MDIVIIGLVVVNILTVITSYLINSRCTHIKTCCCEIDRNLKEEVKEVFGNV